MSVTTAATSGGTFSGGSPNVFTPTTTAAVANNTTMQTSLNAGAGVTINTASAAAGTGDLTIGATVAKTAGATATLTLNAVRDLAINFAISSTTGTMPLVLSAGRAISSSDAIVSNGGNITINTVQPFTLGNSLSAGAGQIFLQTGSLQSPASQTVTASTVQVSAGASWNQQGTVVGNLSVSGTISPGSAAAGALQVNGTLTLQSTATTVVDLAGTGQGSTYDSITATGAVAVAGALQLSFLSGFENAIINGNSFTILAGSSVSGTFNGLPNLSRITLPNELGSVKITYGATNVVLSDWQPFLRELTWDPGTADVGTQVLTNTNTRAGRHYFHIQAQVTDIGAWKTRLAVSSAEADLYMLSGSVPETIYNYNFKSERVGSDGIMLRSDQYTAGQDWYFMVNATAGAQWSIFTGRAFVQNLGTLAWTDTNANGVYDIGETALPSGSGNVTVGVEGIRFFKTVVPTGTPAWSLWLHGSTRDVAVRQNFVPFHDSTSYYDRKQAGQMLVVPPYLTGLTSTYFLSVIGNPGDAVNLDSRIQEVTDIGFNTLQTNVGVTAAPYRVYRVQVPVQQIAWDVAVTPSSGDANVCVRRDNPPSEYENDAYSEVTGSSIDSVTLVPDFLTDATWFITVYGSSPYTFTLRNGPPTITPLNFTDTKVNDQTTRAGWRFYALTDVNSQLGSLGWELNLANQVPGTEIAIRRNAVPSRWQNRAYSGNYNYNGTGSRVDYSGTGGFLQRPGHQADIWYVGIYTPTQALGAFTLTSAPIVPVLKTFDGSTQSVTNQEPGRWKFVRVDVPAGVLGWDVRLRGVSGAMPEMVVRRDQLPNSTGTSYGWPDYYYGYYPSASQSWPSGVQWGAGAGSSADWTGWNYDIGDPTYAVAPPRLVMGTGRPLEAGTYYVGIYNRGYDPQTGQYTLPGSYTLDSRGIGAGQTYPITATLAYGGGTAAISNLAPREAKYFKVTIPANTPSWEVTLDPSAGEMALVVRRGAIPDFNANVNGDANTEYPAGQAYGDVEVKMQKAGPERYVMLPGYDLDYIPAGDYYLAVVSEGVNPTGAIGTGTSSGTLTSLGPLAVTNLGNATPAGLTQAVSLVGGQIKAFTFTVPVGTNSLEVRLDNPAGAPQMAIYPGTRIPALGGYGVDGGSSGSSVSPIFTQASPTTGTWTVVMQAGPSSGTYPNATASMVFTALSPVPLAFDGGTQAVVNQPAGSWRYFQVTVPAGVLGWDVRLRGVSGAMPEMVVRRDQLPNSTGTSYGWPDYYYGYYPSASQSWPSGVQWGAGAGSSADWTGWNYDIGDPTYAVAPPRLVMGTGRPLEAGTYYVGIYNRGYDPQTGQYTLPGSYTLDSRGIGAGQTYPITATLAYGGGTAAISNLAPREAKYFKVTIPANTPSWEVTLDPSAGEMALVVRRGAIPDFNANVNGDANTEYPAGQAYGDVEVKMQKAGPERYVMLPGYDLDYIPAGDYYLAVVSEGVNPTGAIGTGTSSGTLTSLGPLAVTNLGNATPAGLTQAVSLVGGQIKAFTFTVPVGTNSLEVRLDSPAGAPVMWVYPGSVIPVPYDANYYGSDGGGNSNAVSPIFTQVAPVTGMWTVVIKAGYNSGTYPNATASMVFKTKPNIPLNFDISQNGSGSSHTDSRQALDGEYNIYKVTTPATVSGQPVIGWIIKTDVLQGAVSLQVYKDFSNPGSLVSVNEAFAVIVPPVLTLGDTWYVRVRATGLTNYTITSRPVTIEPHPFTPGGPTVWPMPTVHNLTFGDSGNDSAGNPLPGDRGVDLAQGEWHFYAVDVPNGNAGLLRTELQAISGNPDLYIREDGVPTTSHTSNPTYYGSVLYQHSLTGTVSEYGNWVPLDGRTQRQLTSGRWYLGVKAGGNSNVRYRLIVSTGQVTDLALDPSLATAQVPASVTNQILVDNDWRYYRFTVPANAPNNWALTFGQQVGDVVMWLRDSLPPGQGSLNSNSAGYIESWSSDNKNQGPYSYGGHDAAGTYTFNTPSLRPGHTYYVGFRSNNSATFSVSSATSGGTIGVLPSLDFYTGTVTTSIPANGSVLYKIPVSAEATRFKYSAVHMSTVQVRLEQGTLPGTTGSQHFSSSGANSSLNSALATSTWPPNPGPNQYAVWPWQPNQTYYVRFVNSDAIAQAITFTMNGTNGFTEDEDNDGLPDAWEVQYFGSIYSYNGASDPDNDGNSNAVEFADGTNPTDAASAKYSLTLLARNGTAIANPVQVKYNKGSLVTLTNTPSAGYSFVGWSGGPFRSDDFAVRATGTITLPTGGTWTFGANSDDGVRVKVNNTTIVTDDGPHSSRDTFGQITLAAGDYAIEVVYYDRTGGETLEVFAAPGTKASFDGSFRLVGDTAGGGLAVRTLSGGLSVPGFTVRQVESLSTPIYYLSYADALLAGSYAKRQDVTAIADVLNFANYGLNDGHFTNSNFFPLALTMADNPVSVTMNGNYTITAMNSIPLATALDGTGLVWTTGDNAPWLGENSPTSQDGVDAAASGPVDDGQQSRVQTIVEGPGVLTYYWKVSSASGDYLSFRINDAIQESISGEVAWTQRTYNVSAGTQALSWVYAKDAIGTAGSDRAWLDQVTYVPTRYTLTINASGGTVTRSPDKTEYLPGEMVTLTAIPNTGNLFTGWSGDLTGSTSPATITMNANRIVTAGFVTAPVFPASAVESESFKWTTFGDLPWTNQSAVTHDGVDAARSGAITHNQSSWAEMTVILYQADTLRFWWKVSSEANYDYLRVAVDGVNQVSISGEVGWEQRSLSLAAGPHTIRWTYSKDGSVNSGQDAAFLDEVRFDTHTTPFAGWAASHGLTGASAMPNADADGDGLVNLIEYGFGFDPSSPTITPLPQAQKVGTNFVVSFPEPPGVSGIIYGAEWSPTLVGGNWQPMTDTGTGNVHIFSVPVGTNTKMFMRLTVASP